MRIDAYTQVQQIYQSQKVSKPQTAKKVSFADQLQLSSMGKDMQVAKTAVAQAADIRADVVSSIKAEIQDGTYSVDAGSFADKLFAKYEQMR